MQRVKIQIRGHIDRNWSDWLGDLSINHASNGSTFLTGTVSDHAALYGLLSQLSNLGLQLVSVSSANMNKTRSVKGVQV
jgi:hypothetical protein